MTDKIDSSGKKVLKKTIFFVEDEKTLVELVSEFLRSKGYRIEAAYNGNQAIQMLPVVRPDLILLDLVMPEMSGIDFLKKIQIENSEFASVPVLVLSNLHGDEENLGKMGLKIKGYFIKANLRLEELADRIVIALDSGKNK